MGKAFGRAIKEAIAAGLVTREALKKATGLTAPSVTRWTTGENTPEGDNLEKILSAVADADWQERLRWAWLEDKSPPDAWRELQRYRASGRTEPPISHAHAQAIEHLNALVKKIKNEDEISALSNLIGRLGERDWLLTRYWVSQGLNRAAEAEPLGKPSSSTPPSMKAGGA
jgi:hypothetical protein